MNKSTVQRIKEYIDFKQLSIRQFEQSTSMSNGALGSQIKNNKSIGSDKIENILNIYSDINPAWLLTGDGPMIKNEHKTSNEFNEPLSEYSLRTDSNVENQRIPLFNLEATAGVVPLFEDSSKQTPVDFISIPNLPKCDGAIFVTGDSMYPLLKSGDIVIYKQISNFYENIFWGEMYIISIDMDGDEYVAVKFIQKSDDKSDYIKMVSHNKHHQDKEVNIKNIRAMALVKASVRINSMS